MKLIKKASVQKSTWPKRMVVWSYIVVLGLAKNAMKQKGSCTD